MKFKIIKNSMIKFINFFNYISLFIKVFENQLFYIMKSWVKYKKKLSMVLGHKYRGYLKSFFYSIKKKVGLSFYNYCVNKKKDYGKVIVFPIINFSFVIGKKSFSTRFYSQIKRKKIIDIITRPQFLYFCWLQLQKGSNSFIFFKKQKSPSMQWFQNLGKSISNNKFKFKSNFLFSKKQAIVLEGVSFLIILFDNKKWGGDNHFNQFNFKDAWVIQGIFLLDFDTIEINEFHFFKSFNNFFFLNDFIKNLFLRKPFLFKYGMLWKKSTEKFWLLFFNLVIKSFDNKFKNNSIRFGPHFFIVVFDKNKAFKIIKLVNHFFNQNPSFKGINKTVCLQVQKYCSIKNNICVNNRLFNKKDLFKQKSKSYKGSISNIELILIKNGFLKKNGLPTRCGRLIHIKPVDILKYYKWIEYEILGFYKEAQNFKLFKVYVSHKLKYSCALTLASKIRLRTLRKTFKRYGSSLSIICK